MCINGVVIEYKMYVFDMNDPYYYCSAQHEVYCVIRYTIY